MKKYWILLLLIFSFTANATEERSATLSWNNPTEYNDGSPLSAGDIAGYHLYWEEGADPTAASSRIDIPAAGGINTYVANFMMQPRPEPYVYHFKLSVYLTDGRESGLSNTSIKDFGVVKSSALPNAPTGLSVSSPLAGQ